MKAAMLATSFAVILLSCACATTSDPLVGTEWRLVRFQSMDDATGTLSPDTGSEFTMRLNADGTVSMVLDCNRASGSWTSERAASGESGRFTFGPLAGTRARCAPPNLDERILRDANFVRSYLLKDGHLYLSLFADGGVYEWAPLRPAD